MQVNCGIPDEKTINEQEGTHHGSGSIIHGSRCELWCLVGRSVGLRESRVYRGRWGWRGLGLLGLWPSRFPVGVTRRSSTTLGWTLGLLERSPNPLCLMFLHVGPDEVLIDAKLVVRTRARRGRLDRWSGVERGRSGHPGL